MATHLFGSIRVIDSGASLQTVVAVQVDAESQDPDGNLEERSFTKWFVTVETDSAVSAEVFGSFLESGQHFAVRMTDCKASSETILPMRATGDAIVDLLADDVMKITALRGHGPLVLTRG